MSFTNTVLPVISTTKSIVCEGKTTVLRTSKLNPIYSLQWLKDGVAISGANKDSLVVSQTGNYQLQTSGGTCNGNSNGLNISITNLNLPAPQIENLNVYNYRFSNYFETCGNNVVKLKVKDYKDGDLTWLKDGNVITGQTGTELLARQSGNYAVRYQGNELCFAQSALVPVKITDVATMSFAGNDAVAKSGESAKIKYTFTGISPIYLKINNAYENLIVNPITQRYFEDIYSTKTFSATTIANACGVGTFSNPATITVGNYFQSTSFQLSASYVTACIGGSITLTGTAFGSGSPFTYQWQKDGVDIVGANQSSLNISNFTYSDIGYYRVKALGTYGSAISDEIQVNANYGDVVFAKLDYPAYTNSDILLTAFSGSSFGNASNAYHWTGPNGFTSTEQNPVIPNGTNSNNGTYTVTATNAGGCVNYALLTVTVTTAPITLGNLGTTSFCPNGTLSVPFTTTLAIGTLYKVYLSDANGSFRNQSEIGNGMTSPIDITFPQYAQAGTKYRIRIVSIYPSATSSLSGYLSTDGQGLTISVKNLVGREIEPYNTKICNGSALTGIISTNQSGVIYEWKKDGMFQTNNTQLKMTQGGIYIASVTKTGCNNISKTLNVEFGTTAYHFPIRFGSEYQCAGISILYRDIYYSDSATYQWKRNGNILIGETNDTLIANQTGIYTANITDKCPVVDEPNHGSGVNQKVVFSNIIENRISEFMNPPNNGLICGSAIYANFQTLIYPNILAPYTYQWKRNGINLANQTNQGLYYIKEEGLYSLSLTQGNCTVNSNGIELMKVDTIKLGLKLVFPTVNNICQGATTYLRANIPAGVNYTFYKDGIALSNSPNPDLFAVSETGNYNVSGNSSGCVIVPSDTIKVVVGDSYKPKISYLLGNTICDSNAVVLDYWTGFQILQNATYQWFKNNVPIPNEINRTIYVLQPGFYKLRITSGSCTGFTDSVEVKTGNLEKPIIYHYSNNFFKPLSKLEVCSNNTVYLYSSDSGNDSYQSASTDSLFWKRNNQLVYKSIGGSNQLFVTQSGIYTLTGKRGNCVSPESDPVEIKIGEPITANITGSTSIYPGQKAKLNLNFTGGNAWSYQTSDVATGQTTSLSPTLKTVNPSNTQTYAITSVASNCGVGTVTGNATVTVLPCPTDKTISINSGNWNTSTTWSCGQIPTSTLDAIIEQGHIVNLPNGYQGNTKKLDLRGGITQGVGAGVKVGN